MTKFKDKYIPQDFVITPDWVASDMVEFFKPSGLILDPCKGTGIFGKYLPEHEWCEIKEGKDFFEWNKQVDWCFGNPPYSIFRRWLNYSFEISQNIVYLIPIQKLVLGYGQVTDIRKHGWIKHIRWYGTGTKMKWLYGNAIGAAYFQKGWFGDTSWSFYEDNK